MQSCAINANSGTMVKPPKSLVTWFDMDKTKIGRLDLLEKVLKSSSIIKPDQEDKSLRLLVVPFNFLYWQFQANGLAQMSKAVWNVTISRFKIASVSDKELYYCKHPSKDFSNNQLTNYLWSIPYFHFHKHEMYRFFVIDLKCFVHSCVQLHHG